MTVRNRLLILLAAVTALAAVARRRSCTPPAPRGPPEPDPAGRARASTPGTGHPRPTPEPHGLPQHGLGPAPRRIATVPPPDPCGPRTASGVKCLRFYAAAGTGVCLQAVHGAAQDTYRALVLDAHLTRDGTASRRRRASPPAPGSRPPATWSPGRSFVGGDSYARHELLHPRGHRGHPHLGELIPTWRRSASSRTASAYRAADVNFWGVTFASDDHTLLRHAGDQRQDLPGPGRLCRPARSPPCTRTSSARPCPPTAPASPTRSGSGPPARRPVAPVRPRPAHDARDPARRAPQRRRPGRLARRPHHRLRPARRLRPDLWTVPADGTGTARRLMVSALAPAYLG